MPHAISRFKGNCLYPRINSSIHRYNLVQTSEGIQIASTDILIAVVKRKDCGIAAECKVPNYLTMSLWAADVGVEISDLKLLVKRHDDVSSRIWFLTPL